MTMLAEACQETLPALAELAAGVTRPEGSEPDGHERRRWSLMEGVGSRRLHLVRPEAPVPFDTLGLKPEALSAAASRSGVGRRRSVHPQRLSGARFGLTCLTCTFGSQMAPPPHWRCLFCLARSRRALPLLTGALPSGDWRSSVARSYA